MKNLISSALLLAFVLIYSVPAAAESVSPPSKPFTITLDSVADIFTMRTMFGDYADKTPANAGSPYRYQGGGDFSFFQSSRFDDPLEARAKFEFIHERFGGLLQMRAAVDSAFSGVWDWEAWGRPFSFLKLLTGNQARRGSVERFQNFDDFLRTKIDSFGIMFPAWQRNPTIVGGNNVDTVANFPFGYDGPDQDKGFAVFTGTDTDDLFMPAGSLVRQTLGFLIEGNLEEETKLLPFDLSLSLASGGIFNNSRPFKDPWGAGGTRANGYDSEYDPLETKGASFGARLEGSKTGLSSVDPVTVALVYKYAASALKKEAALDPPDSLDEKIDNHTFGLYFNLGTPSGFSLSAGYSGFLRSWKNAKWEQTDPEPSKTGTEEHKLSAYKEIRFPYYSGIDLRFNYAGIPGINLTLNNNISFADVTGTVNRKLLYSQGWAYETQLNEDTVSGIEKRKETYLGLYNALGVSCSLTGALTLNVQIANQMGTFTLNWEQDALRAMSNYLGGYAGVDYTFAIAGRAKASVRSGLAVRYASFSFQSPPSINAAKPNNTAGFLDFGFPLGLKIEF